MINPEEIRNVVISRTDRIGDVILTLPLVSEAKRLFKNANVCFMVSEYVGDLLKGYKDIDNLVFIKDYPTTRDLIKFFKENKTDVVINAFPRPKISFAQFRAGVKHRLGTTSRWYSFVYNNKVNQHRSRCEKNETDYNLDLLAKFVDGVSYEKKYKFEFNAEEREEVKRKLAEDGVNCRYIIVHPGSGGSAADLPAEKFKEFITKAGSVFPDYRIILTGTDRERNLIQSIKDDKSVDLSGKFGLRELAVLIDGCSLFLSNSTGPIHIAGALGKNIMGFYPNSKPINATRWSPPGDPRIFTPPDGTDEMNKIDISVVINKASEILK